MAIRFPCPHCQKTITAKDHLAGKKASCPSCKQALTIPALVSAPMDVEELAAAALSEQPAASAAAVTQAKIAFECPFCDSRVELGAELAGKQAPCPECRRIVKVPLPTKTEPRDWRKTGSRGPAGAARDLEPAPEGTWSSTTTTRVSERALVEADVITEAREPWTLGQKVRWGGGAVVAVALLAGGGWGLLALRSASRQASAIEKALLAVSNEPAKPKIGFEQDAAIHRAAGEFFQRTGKRDCALRARERFQSARNLARNANSLDRDLLLVELVILQADLGGTGDDLITGRRIDWNDVHKEMRQTLDSIVTQGVRAEALRLVVRRLLASGQPPLTVMKLAQTASGQTERAPELLAVTGLELLAAGQTAQAHALAQEATRALTPPPPPMIEEASRDPLEEKPRKPKKPVSEPELLPVPSSLVALWVALGRQDEAGKLSKDPAYPIGYAEGLARRGDLAEARRQAGAFPLPLDRAKAFVGIAAAALEKDRSDAADVDQAVTVISENLKGNIPPELLLRLLRVSAQARLTDRMERLALVVNDPLRAWAQLEALRAGLAGSQARADEARAEEVKSEGLPRGLARQAVTRHNARQDGSLPRSIDSWDEPLRPFGHSGVALGLQDRSQ